MSHEEAINKASRAKQILEDDLVKDAFAQLESAIINQWTELSVENRAQAEELKRLLWASKQFKNVFEVLISGGQVAKHELLLQSMEIKREAALKRVYG